ncbi:MAG: nuclear transport factor 2 family protein [Cyanobacteria bacterium P01_D01_bin.1]
MAPSSASASDRIEIEGIPLPGSIQRYFKTANAGEFEQTAALFAEDGQLVPPFEQPIVGRDAIAQYLTAEATGMSFVPIKSEVPDLSELESDHATSQRHYLVRGKVKTSLFTVNVAWKFTLNQSQAILVVKVKLLAKLNELLKLKS